MEIRFKLNPANEKDKIILDFLSKEYAPSTSIKNILYKMALEGEIRSETELDRSMMDDRLLLHKYDMPDRGEMGSITESGGEMEDEFAEYFN